MITSFKGEDTNFAAITNLSQRSGATFSSPPGSRPSFGQLSISPGGDGLSAYHRRLAEACPCVRTFVHADPGADNLPAPSPGEFDQALLKWAIERADRIAVCWPASAEDTTQTPRLAKWIAGAIRKSVRGFIVVKTTAEWHLEWLYFGLLWRRKGAKLRHFGAFPARSVGAR
jgi:hypothetical protein